MTEERVAARGGIKRVGRWFVPLAVLLVAGSLLLAALSLVPGRGPAGLGPALAEAKSRSQLAKELEDNRQRLAKAREGIRQAEATRKDALEDIVELDQKIDTLETDLARVERERDQAAAELDATREELTTLEAAITKKRAELQKAEQDLQTQQNRLDARATSIYKGGSLSYLEVLLTSRQLTDLVNRLELLSLVIEQDNEILGQIKELKARVSAEKAALQREEARLSEVEKRQEAQTQKLNGLVAERESKLDQLDDARDAKRAIVEKAEQDKASWEQQEEKLRAESGKIEAELRKLATQPPSGGKVVKGSGQMIWPVEGRLSSRFGYRTHPIFKTRKMHTGIDLGAGSGTPIKAADGGTVIFAGWRGGYGKTVIISHGRGIATLYAHQSTILVGQGQTVGKGQVIGKVGSTGYSTGPHLHFEVRVNGSPVDPLKYL